MNCDLLTARARAVARIEGSRLSRTRRIRNYQLPSTERRPIAARSTRHRAAIFSRAYLGLRRRVVNGMRPNGMSETERGPMVEETQPVADPRRTAREWALQALFEGDLVNHSPLAILDRVEDDDELADATATEQARRLVTGVLSRREEIDREIARAAPAWPIAQMPAVDK